VNYVKEIAVLLVAALLFGGGWHLGGLKAERDAAQAKRDAMAEKLDEVLKAQAEDKARAKRLQDTLDKLPKAEGPIREAVRDNPSNCVRPPVVAERVRKAASEANAARALPGNP
jgi:hypothetical protein